MKKRLIKNDKCWGYIEEWPWLWLWENCRMKWQQNTCGGGRKKQFKTLRKHSHKTEAALHSYKRRLPTDKGSTVFLTFWCLDELNKGMFHVVSLPEYIHRTIQGAVRKHSKEPTLRVNECNGIRMASRLWGDPHITNKWINISPIKPINTKIETTKYSLFQFPLLTNIFR